MTFLNWFFKRSALPEVCPKCIDRISAESKNPFMLTKDEAFEQFMNQKFEDLDTAIESYELAICSSPTDIILPLPDNRYRGLRIKFDEGLKHIRVVESLKGLKEKYEK